MKSFAFSSLLATILTAVAGHAQHNDCAVEGIADRPEFVQAMIRQRGDMLQRLDPTKTSDQMRGTITVALFLVENAAAPSWTAADSTATVNNITTNNTFWEDIGKQYNANVEFTLQTFGPSHPASRMPKDPTSWYNPQSFSSGDDSLIINVMWGLGYRTGTARERARAFCHDLRVERGTDWAFAAFILKGNTTVRAHASLLGPTTVMMLASARASLTFAHEVGHIFGAFDAYYEEGMMQARSMQSRHGIPNANVDWRSFPIMPSIMAVNQHQVDGYVAGHIQLIDSVEFFTVQTVPAGAPYEIVYTGGNGARYSPYRYRTTEKFAWGRGCTVTLRALPVASADGQELQLGTWSNGLDSMVVNVDSTTPKSFTLTYNVKGASAPFVWDYLVPGRHLPGKAVQSMAAVAAVASIDSVMPGNVAFASNRGCSVLPSDSTSGLMLDVKKRDIDRSTLPRPSMDVTTVGNSGLAFATDFGQIILYDHAQARTLNVHGSDVQLRSISEATPGSLWVSDGGYVGARAFPGSLLYRASEAGSTLFRQTDGLPPLPIVGLCPVGEQVLLACSGDGRGTSGQGIYWYDPSAATSRLLGGSGQYTSVRKMRTWNDGSVVTVANDTVARRSVLLRITDDALTTIPLLGVTGTINDVLEDYQGTMIVGTSTGLWVREDERWRVLNAQNSEMPSTAVLALATDGQALYAATDDLVVRLRLPRQTSSVDSRTSSATRLRLSDAVVSTDVRGSLDVLSGDVDVHVIDVLGFVVASTRLLAQPGVQSLVNVRHLPSGRYHIICQDAHGVAAAPFIIMR